jgi:hypothetical protein
MKKEAKAALSHAQKQARNAKATLARLKVDVSHSQALEVIAGIAGFSNWHAYRAHICKVDSATEPVEATAVEGWFDVEAYKTSERWNGPDRENEGLDGFNTLQAAVDYANGPEFSNFYQVVVSAYGRHAEYEAGERVYSRFNRETSCSLDAPEANGTAILADIALYRGDQFLAKETVLADTLDKAIGAMMARHWDSRLDSVTSSNTFEDILARPVAPTMSEISDWLIENGTEPDDMTRLYDELLSEAEKFANPRVHATLVPEDSAYEYILGEVSFLHGKSVSWTKFVSNIRQILDIDSWPFDHD